jgi:hypothetical protein
MTDVKTSDLTGSTLIQQVWPNIVRLYFLNNTSHVGYLHNI